MTDIKELKGKTMIGFELRLPSQGIHLAPENGIVDSIKLITKNGATYKIHHEQEQYENVFISQIEGDFNHLLNAPITKAKRTENDNGFIIIYYLATQKGEVKISWRCDPTPQPSLDVIITKRCDE